MTVDNTGNTVIGSTAGDSVNGKLTVNGTSLMNNTILMKNISTIATSTSNVLTVGNTNTTTVDNSGNTVIGNSNPWDATNSTLTVNGVAKINNNLYLSGNSGGSSTPQISIFPNSTSSAGSELFKVNSTVGTGNLVVGPSNATSSDITVNGTMHINNTTDSNLSNGLGSNPAVVASAIFQGGVSILKSLYVANDIYASTLNGSFVTSSDRSLKENVEPLANSLDNVLALQGVNFNWIDTEKYNSDRQVGFIAQDVEAVIPELVVTREDGIKGVNYSQMVAVLVEAIKEQNKIIQKLQADVAELQQK